MRTLIVILLIPVFAMVFLLAITLNQVVSTVSSEDLVVRLLDDVEIYDYFYDDLMVRLSDDLTAREYEIKFYREDREFIHVLKMATLAVSRCLLTMFFLGSTSAENYVRISTLASHIYTEDRMVLQLISAPKIVLEKYH